jgi:hypothetical protein
MKNIAYLSSALFLIVQTAGIADERKCPSTINNSYQCSKFLEKELARDYPNLFSRYGKSLVIALASGKKKTYIDILDKKNDGVDGIRYNFVQYFPEIGYGLIAVHYYEGGTRYLVNMTNGKDKDIISSPEISPDKKRIAVANVDFEAQYTPNVLSVFEIRPDGLVSEFHEKPDNWGPGDLRWKSNQEISFTAYRLKQNHDPNQPLVGTPKKLKYRAQGKKGVMWAIE